MAKEEDEYILKPMTQAELNEIIRRHQNFLTAKPGGARAVVRDRDLTGLSFIGQNLSQSDFTGCIMAYSDLTGANFESSTLFGIDLTGAKLTNTKLTRADMRGCEIGSADLSMANLQGADLRQGRTIVKRKVKSKDDQYAKTAEAGIVMFTGSDLSGANLAGATAISADFSDAILENAKMQGINLQGAVLKGADLSNVDLTQGDIRNADFSYATMTGAAMEKTEKSGSNFTLTLTGEDKGKPVEEMPLTLDELIINHTKWVATMGKQGTQLSLEEVDMRKGPKLSSKRITAMRANKCMFAEMDLRSVELQGANLDDSDFRKCLFQSADLRGARFRHAMMNRANFSRANMNPLVLKKPDGVVYHFPCRMESATLRNAVFDGTRLMEARFSKCDLAGAKFTDCDLRKADFIGADLKGVKFDNCLLEDAAFDEDSDPRKQADTEEE